MILSLKRRGNILKKINIILIGIIVISLIIYKLPKIENEEVVVKEEESELESYQKKYNNKDIKLLLKIDEVIDNEVVLQGDDNSYYLEHNPLKDLSKGGSLIVDYRIDLNTSKKIIIYGHSSNDLDLVFNNIEKYQDINYLKTYPNIEITLEDDKRLYQVFSVMNLQEEYFYTKLDFNQDEWLLHLEELSKRSIIPIDYEASKSDEILILQTCSQQDLGSYVVVSAVLKEREKI